MASRSVGGEVRVVTRMRPKRMPELLDAGALYWIVQHRLVACMPILRFEDRPDGRIDIVCADRLLAVPPASRRAHQGWRYLTHEEAPKPGDNDDSGLALLPPGLFGRLTALALV